MTVVEQIETLLAATPWLTLTEIASAINKGRSHVSGVVYRMRRDGRLVREDQIGPLDGYGYALANPQHAKRNAAALAEKRTAGGRVGRAICKAAARRGKAPCAPDVDWRPEETIPEDYSAL